MARIKKIIEYAKSSDIANVRLYGRMWEDVYREAMRKGHYNESMPTVVYGGPGDTKVVVPLERAGEFMADEGDITGVLK